ncbi:hypothetical protein K488DRAFT_77072 [Vararia minispora EC-137]|uniref:Uncharacterized protein n=1 Tax=Vararia minispora EC-137 TaxID=1314806 RepID=A0ACB8QS03_9AGAM|nr:hypothetical protein K488DRAFT_77072 [Vararia minispora EC-137]
MLLCTGSHGSLYVGGFKLSALWYSSVPSFTSPSFNSCIVGFFARDYSLWLGWNNMRYIIDAAFLNAKLLNRTLIVPSFVYARACEHEPQMVNKGKAMNDDRRDGGPPEQQMAWRIPLPMMLNITRMRESHPVILISDYLRLHNLSAELETGDGSWDRERYHANTNLHNMDEPRGSSLFVVENDQYDLNGIVRVDYLPDDMRARGKWSTVNVTGDNTARGRWAMAERNDISSRLSMDIRHSGTVIWNRALRRLKQSMAKDLFDLESDAGVVEALHHAGWEVVYTFEAVANAYLAKTVVEPIREAVPRTSLHPWAEEYKHISADVLLLAGETHGGRKPGSLLFTTPAAREEYQRMVLHELVPVDMLQDLADTLVERMFERTEDRMWMGAHMRRTDFMAGTSGSRFLPSSHLTRVKARLEQGRQELEQMDDVHLYEVPDVQPNIALFARDPPKQGDPFYVATDERDPDVLQLFRDGGAILLSDILVTDDYRAIGWPLMFTDVRAIVEQALLARAACFCGTAGSSVSGGIVNMRAAHGADQRTTLFD